MKVAAAFLAGVVFALGLGLAGMTQPSRVLAFLDVTGNWDPTLALVMATAVTVTATAFPFVLRRARPLYAEGFSLPRRSAIDARLVAGAGTFGVGWGLAGLCPGPALVCVVTGHPHVLVFVAAMTLGLLLGRRWTRDDGASGDDGCG